ncbi:MAG: hypothetical protein H6767_06640 [Candidatus Peribacteria bacterium]|nr:MAG: hypothetical protein H6767_06640 [Candidatus Peribacteria bacterium]
MKMYERLQDINTRIKAAKIQGNIQKAELLESFKKWNITTKSDTRYEKKLFELLRVLD